MRRGAIFNYTCSQQRFVIRTNYILVTLHTHQCPSWSLETKNSGLNGSQPHREFNQINTNGNFNERLFHGVPLIVAPRLALGAHTHTRECKIDLNSHLECSHLPTFLGILSSLSHSPVADSFIKRTKLCTYLLLLYVYYGKNAKWLFSHSINCVAITPHRAETIVDSVFLFLHGVRTARWWWMHVVDEHIVFHFFTREPWKDLNQVSDWILLSIRCAKRTICGCSVNTIALIAELTLAHTHRLIFLFLFRLFVQCQCLMMIIIAVVVCKRSGALSVHRLNGVKYSFSNCMHRFSFFVSFILHVSCWPTDFHKTHDRSCHTQNSHNESSWLS